jgi:hypothetical protein
VRGIWNEVARTGVAMKKSGVEKERWRPAYPQQEITLKRSASVAANGGR